MTYIILYLLFAVPCAYAPREIGHFFGKKFGRVIFNNRLGKSIFDVQSYVKRRRVGIGLLMVTVASVTTYAALRVLATLAIINAWHPYVYVSTIGALTVMALLFYKLAYTPKYFEVNEKSKSFYTLQHIVETVSIAAGVAAPQVKVYAQSVPAVFLQVPVFQQPTLCATTHFLNNFSHSEIEACVAHEIGSFLTQEIKIRKIIRALMVISEISGLVLCIGFLGLLQPALPFVWLMTHVFVAVSTHEYVYILSDKVNLFRIAFLLLNPIYLLLIITTQFIYYISSVGEMLYADAKAIDLTRYPQGLYFALIKMSLYINQYSFVSFAYVPLIINDDSFFMADTSFIRSLIEKRKEYVRSLDYTITDRYSPVDPLVCSVCGVALKTIKVDGFHEKGVQVGVCLACHLVWFDDGMLYDLSSADTSKVFLEYAKSSSLSLAPIPSCPRCGITLSILSDSHLPKGLRIFHCHVCYGDMISAADFMSYSIYRKHRLNTSNIMS